MFEFILSFLNLLTAAQTEEPIIQPNLGAVIIAEG